MQQEEEPGGRGEDESFVSRKENEPTEQANKHRKQGKTKSKQEQNLTRVTSITRNRKDIQDRKCFWEEKRQQSDQSGSRDDSRMLQWQRERAPRRNKDTQRAEQRAGTRRRREKHRPRGSSREEAESCCKSYKKYIGVALERVCGSAKLQHSPWSDSRLPCCDMLPCQSPLHHDGLSPLKQWENTIFLSSSFWHLFCCQK